MIKKNLIVVCNKLYFITIFKKNYDTQTYREITYTSIELLRIAKYSPAKSGTVSTPIFLESNM
jgi:hypothetical protein